MGLIEKYVLFTNLDMVFIGDVRTHCSALLLERTEGFLNRGQYQCKVRGFGPDPAWAIFDLFLRTPDIEYALQSAQSESVSTIRSSPGIASRFRTGLPTRAFISSATRR